MFCKNCGNELKEGVKFCNKCGTPIGVIQTSENQEVPQAAVSPDKNAIIGKSYIFNNTFPYTDIKAFHFENKVYISHTIMSLFDL